MTMLHDPERLARLKLSVGTLTHDNRPMTPVEVAFAIREFVDETGEGLPNIAKRLGVTVDTCKMFLAILDLPKDWHGIWHFGRSDSSRSLPFSMAGKIAPKFKNGNLTKNDLDMLKGAALDPEKPARRDDITNILAYHSKNPEKTLQDCIKTIMNLTPEKISSYVVITDINPKFLKPDDQHTRNSVLDMLKKYFPNGSVEDLRIKDGSHLMILFDEQGYDKFYEMARRRNIPAKNLINYLRSEEK